MYHYDKSQCPWRCPVCEDSSFKMVDKPELDGDHVYVDWRCSKCRFEWCETFKFHEWEPILEDDWTGEGVA